MTDKAKGMPDVDAATFKHLIEESSLGTSGARALRKRVGTPRVEALWQRADELVLGQYTERRFDAVTADAATDDHDAPRMAIASVWAEPMSAVFGQVSGGAGPDYANRTDTMIRVLPNKQRGALFMKTIAGLSTAGTAQTLGS